MAQRDMAVNGRYFCDRINLIRWLWSEAVLEIALATFFEARFLATT